jgi:signal transduction histidine kinase
VEAGDLSQRIENISNDEIGKFGEVFNVMVNNIRELDRLKSEFISVAAHQLRTPLSAVKWAVKMVMDGDAGSVNEEQKGLLDQGYKSNERMILLINDLLDVSRIEAGKFEYEFIDGSIEDLVDATIQEFQQIVKHKSVNLKYFKPDVRLPKVKIDPLKLKMVIENLIDNAVKYTPSGGKVDVLFKYYRDTIEFVVADSGVGIPKDQVAQLFSKFFRAKNVIRMQTDGTGLGLFIAKRIVEKHGGIIWAESEEGKGRKCTSLFLLSPDKI